MRSSFHRIDLLAHAWMLHACLADFDAEASMDLAGFTLEVRARNRRYSLYPRFVVRHGEHFFYGVLPSRETRAFAGWLPYVNKRWHTGSGKLAFKAFCHEKGLPTPRLWRSPEAAMRDFLVKLDVSSSAMGIRGPFVSYDPAAPEQALPPGGYYEQFIRGCMVKAWFWEERLVAIDLLPMPRITGNGKSSVRELIATGCAAGRAPANWRPFAEIARYQGSGLEAVLPEGQELIADFRYASPLLPATSDNVPTLDRHKDSAAVHELRRFGPILWHDIPEDVRPATLFTLDAIVDAEDQVWLLEINCNPVVHPEVYPFMLERLFGPRASAAQSRPASAPLLPANALPRQGIGPDLAGPGPTSDRLPGPARAAA